MPPLLGVVLPDLFHRVLAFFRLDDAEFVHRLTQAVIIIGLAWGALWLVRGSARRIERAAQAGAAGEGRLTDVGRRGRTLADLVRSVGGTVVVLAAALMVLDLFINIGPLVAGLGVVGLAVSFGAQALVKDVIAGFFLLLENHYGVGDVVRVANVEGTVERVTLRSTVLRDGHGVVHFVPNGQVDVVSNLTRQWSRAVVDVGVSYTEDVDRAMKVLREVLREFATDAAWRDRVLGEPTVTGVEALGESRVELRAWVNVVPGAHGEAERELRRRIKNRFDKEGIEIPVPQRVIHMAAGAERKAATP
jgi:moderate conductance mechanosensitive channel